MWQKTPNSGQRRRKTYRPEFDVLEDRCVPALITVNSLGDETVADEWTTLREAIAQARLMHGDDVITFGDLAGTIHLTQGSLLIGNMFEGDRSGAVTIEAPSKDIAIDAGGASTVLSIESNTVNLIGLTFQNGRHTGAGGLAGGIMIWDGHFQSFYNPSVVTMVDSKVIGNVADYGGGIYNMGYLEMTNVLVKGNRATDAGGGIYVHRLNSGFGGVLKATSSFFQENTARSGGAILNDGGDVTLTATKVSKNTATRFDGGGIYNAGGTVTLEMGTTVQFNSARNGGGIYNDRGSVNLFSSTVTENVASSGKGNDIYTNTLDSVFSDADSEIGDFLLELPKSKGGGRK